MINRILLSSVMYLLFFIFMGCSKTTVVLLDSGKHSNTILIANDKSEAKLDKVGNYLEVGEKDKVLGKVETMSKAEIEDRFSKVLAIESAKPISYILYFKAKELTDESKDVFKKALKAIKERSPCLVDVIGHTDTTGSNALNTKVSLKRATHIEALIKKENIEIISLTAKGFGEEDLLVETADNVDEAKNRNVEIYIK